MRERNRERDGFRFGDLREESGGGCQKPHARPLGLHFGERAIEWPESSGRPMRRDLPFRWPRAPEDEVLAVSSQEDEH